MSSKAKLFFLVFISLLIGCSDDSTPPLRWHAIHVSGSHSSGDAHLLQIPSGEWVLIDTGYEAYADPVLIPYLKKLGVESLDLVVVTHAHKNHYGGLIKLKEQFDIKALAFTLPDIDTCAREKKGDRCNRAHALRSIEVIGADAKILETKTGSTLFETPELKLDVIHQALSIKDHRYSELANQGVGFTVNDSSAILRLEFAGQSILFPGDASKTTGKYLTEFSNIDLKSTLLAAPHHGVTPLPTTSFFEAVNPQAIIVSISNPPFDGARGQPLRDYAEQANVPLYVMGKTGNLVITLNKRGFTVEDVE